MVTLDHTLTMWTPANTATGKPKKDDDNDRSPLREMERQYESPLYAMVNRRKPLFIDELPARQLESPLEALLNNREPKTLDQATERIESPLYALTNQREAELISELAHRQFESPMSAVVNQHENLRCWRSPKALRRVYVKRPEN